MEAVTHVPKCFSQKLSPSIFCGISLVKARLVRSLSILLKLTDSLADESVTAATAELCDDCPVGMFV